MRAGFSVTFLLALTSIQPCFGQHMNSPEAPCRDDASTLGMANCFAGAREHADRELQEFYEQVRTKLPDDFPDLQNAERLWLPFRDATCSAERSFYEGGTAAPVVYEACMEEETRIRVKDLKTTYQWRLDKFAK
jgi:uncharacterized protein YecT (DUF1311 family)